VLPAKGVLAALLTEMVFLTALVGYILVRYHTLPWTIVLLPLLLFFQFLAMVGASLFFSALGAYFRDLKDFVQVFCLINVYLMPVVYLPEWAPAKARLLFALNPFSYMTWCFQDVFYFGHVSSLAVWVVFPLFSLACLSVGHIFFTKLKPYLGNVL
jgi:lipopolysaccharide transport system permease protein